MTDERPDPIAERDPLLGEGQHEVVPASNDEPADYWLVAADAAFPIAQEDVDEAATALVRLRDRIRDAGEERETIELDCHECGKTWEHAGDDEHATCPNCGAAVPVEGIGP